MGFSKIILDFFEITKGNKFAVEGDWNSKTSQNVQNLFFFWKQNLDMFLKEKSWIFLRSPKVVTLL